MFPKKRRSTYIPIQIESFPPSIMDHLRLKQALRRADHHLTMARMYAGRTHR